MLSVASLLLNSASGVTVDDARALNDGMLRRQEDFLKLYRLLRKARPPRRGPVRYVCRTHRCLLLDVFDTPAGPAAYIPAVKNSTRYVETSADPEARQQRTTDNERRRWAERADLLLHDQLEYWVSCDHVLNEPLSGRRVRLDCERHAGVVLI